MNRMPWVLGIVLTLFVGLVIGYLAGSSREPLPRTSRVEPASTPRVETAGPDMGDRVKELERRVARLEADLAAKSKEAEDAKSALAAAQMASAPDPLPDPVGSEDRKRAIGTVRKAFDEMAKKGLLAFMSPENKGLLAEIEKGLLDAGDLAFEFLADMLASNETVKRFLAVSLLGKLNVDKALPLYRKALFESKDDLVRRMASHALATRKIEKALPDLTKAMKEDKDWGVRANSAYGVAKMGERAGVDVLVELYRDDSRPMQERLGVLGGLADVADPSTAPLFRELLSTSKDETTLILSVSVVEKLADKASLSPLQAIIQGGGTSAVKELAKKAYNTIYGQEVYR